MKYQDYASGTRRRNWKFEIEIQNRTDMASKGMSNARILFVEDEIAKRRLLSGATLKDVSFNLSKFKVFWHDFV